MTVKLSPPPRQQYLDTLGNPYVGAKLFTYAAGTTTKQATYADSTGLSANPNPIILDAAGRTPNGLWLTSGASYKFVLTPSTDTDPPTSPIFTEDGVVGVNDEASFDAAMALKVATADLAASSGSALVGFIQAGTGAVARTQQAKDRETVSVTDYATIQAAIDSLGAAGGEVHYPPGEYSQVGVSLPSNVSVVLSAGAKIIQANNTADVFKAEGTLGAAVLLTADAVAGATTLSVADASAYAVGDWLILSDTLDYSADSAAIGYKSGESVMVESAGGTTITLEAPIYGSQLADETYKTANGASVRKVTPVRNVSVTGGEIELLQTSNTNGVFARYVDGVKVQGVRIHKFAGSGVFPRDCRNVDVSGNVIYDGLDDTVSGFPGYGVCVGGACDTVSVHDNTISRVRHGVTTIGGSTGFPVRVKVSENILSATTQPALDTHEAGKGITFSDNTVQGGTGSSGGIQCRTGHTVIRDNTLTDVPGTGIGVVGTNIESVTIRDNELRGIGGYGITVPSACPNLKIKGNTLESIGDSAVSVFGGSLDTRLSPNLVISGNSIAKFGTVTAARSGIVIAGAQTNTVRIVDNIIDVDGGSAGRAIELIPALTGVVEGNKAFGTFSVTAFSLNTLFNFKNYHYERPRSASFTVATNGVFSLSCVSSYNLLAVIGSASAGAGNPNMVFRFRPNSSPQCAAVTGAIANVTFSTGVLTGTTGVAGDCTISAANGALYVENRTASSLVLWLEISGPTT